MPAVTLRGASDSLGQLELKEVSEQLPEKDAAKASPIEEISCKRRLLLLKIG
jgi:hypothetical protein